jgi:hypothetical protein
MDIDKSSLRQPRRRDKPQKTQIFIVTNQDPESDEEAPGPSSYARQPPLSDPRYAGAAYPRQPLPSALQAPDYPRYSPASLGAHSILPSEIYLPGAPPLSPSSASTGSIAVESTPPPSTPGQGAPPGDLPMKGVQRQDQYGTSYDRDHTPAREPPRPPYLERIQTQVTKAPHSRTGSSSNGRPSSVCFLYRCSLKPNDNICSNSPQVPTPIHLPLLLLARFPPTRFL